MEIATMQITVREIKDIVLITITERIDGSTAPEVQNVLESLQRRGRYKLVIDMSQLGYISSAGYRVLLSAQRNSRRYDGEVILAGVPEQILQALDISGFTDYFKIYRELSAVPELEGQ
jgi:anti-sigma B factor antagonist